MSLNLTRGTQTKFMIGTCKNCNKEFKYDKSKHTGKYCSNKCRGLFQEKESIERYLLGKVNTRHTLRKILLKIKDSCWNCDIKYWNEKKLVLEVDHINGDASNNLPENLQLLCPNCHSQTSTFCGRNKGFGRGSRGLSKV